MFTREGTTLKFNVAFTSNFENCLQK